MKVLAVGLLAAFITACAGPGGGKYGHLKGTPTYQACEYQAKVATPTSNSMMADVLREIQVRDMCIQTAVGY